MRKAIFEILEEASKIKSVQERALFLRKHDSQTLRMILEGVFNPTINWLLPKGSPPYKQNEITGSETLLYNFSRKLYLFVEGGNPNLKPMRREFLFIEMLESVHPKDAELLIAMKDKTMPYKGITKSVLKQAFPDMPIGS